MPYFNDYVNSLVVVRENISLLDDYISIRTSHASGYDMEIGFIAVSVATATMGYLIKEVGNLLLNSIYDFSYTAIIQNPDPEIINPILIGLIGEMAVGEEIALLEFSDAIEAELPT